MQISPKSLTLHTDLYQLTMAQGYWSLGLHNRQALFDLFFRELPFAGGYAVACGLADVVQLLEQFTFSKADLDFLANLPAPDGSKLFQSDFLHALAKLRLSIHLEAIPEGTLVFPKEPLLRIQGPLWQCQLLETALLNIINFSTLIATKAARVCYAAKGDTIIEFGLRRAQGPNGGLMASRAAFVGGVDATSNVLAGQQYDIPLRGTHAHSWIMAFPSEEEAFAAYARVMPNNSVFLVDTYQTLVGVEHAIEVGKQLRAKGYPFLGIRLDSGNLASLSISARELLDKAGFKDSKILASNDLDEYRIETLKNQGAKIDTWGVGTRLVTGYDQPALGGVYKLVSIQDEKGHWRNRAKRTDDPHKETIAGIFALHRLEERGEFIKDEMRNIEPVDIIELESKVSLSEMTRTRIEKKNSDSQACQASNLLQSIFRAGEKVYALPDLPTIQNHCKQQLAKLPEQYKILKPTSIYPVEWMTQSI